MKPIFLLLIVGIALYITIGHNNPALNAFTSDHSDSTYLIATAYKNKQSDIQVQGKGTVIRILSDDTEGHKHQRFILQLESAQTLLIAHNIDLAPRIDYLRKGDEVEFYGEYEWNAKGGVVHWTHHDPMGRHPDGWLKHKGATYK